MLGYHQLHNAVTATCAALCLRNEGEDYPVYFLLLLFMHTFIMQATLSFCFVIVMVQFSGKIPHQKATEQLPNLLSCRTFNR